MDLIQNKSQSKTMKRLLIIPVLLLSLGGCAQSLNQQFATGYGLNTLTRQLTTAALTAKKINKAEGIKLEQQQNDIRSSLDAAWSSRTVYADSSQTQLNKATTSLKLILKQLEDLEVK